MLIPALTWYLGSIEDDDELRMGHLNVVPDTLSHCRVDTALYADILGGVISFS